MVDALTASGAPTGMKRNGIRKGWVDGWMNARWTDSRTGHYLWISLIPPTDNIALTAPTNLLQAGIYARIMGRRRRVVPPQPKKHGLGTRLHLFTYALCVDRPSVSRLRRSCVC